MSARARGLTILGGLFLSACGRDLPKVDLASLAEEARLIANHASGETPVLDSLPEMDIRAEPEGIYIVMGRHHAEEWGFFVPHRPDFLPAPGGDPSYTLLRDGVWRYDVAG